MDLGLPAGGWRAEEAVAGNRMALQALRELVVYPFFYARLSPSSLPTNFSTQRLRLTNFFLGLLCELVFCSGPEDCCCTVPLAPEDKPGTSHRSGVQCPPDNDQPVFRAQASRWRG